MNPIPTSHILPSDDQANPPELANLRRGTSPFSLRPAATGLITLVLCFGGWLVSVAGAMGLEGQSSVSPLTSPIGTAGEEALTEGEAQQAAFEAARANPEAVAARAASQTMYAGESGSQAAVTLRATFPSVVMRQDGGPPSLGSGEKSIGFTAANVEQVEEGGGDVGVVQSVAPIATSSSGGHWEPVDLALRSTGAVFEPLNPVVSVRIPKRLAEGAQIPGVGVSLTPVDAHGAPLGGSEGVVEGTGVLFTNTQTDLDTLLKPSTFGVEASAILR